MANATYATPSGYRSNSEWAEIETESGDFWIDVDDEEKAEGKRFYPSNLSSSSGPFSDESIFIGSMKWNGSFSLLNWTRFERRRRAWSAFLISFPIRLKRSDLYLIQSAGDSFIEALDGNRRPSESSSGLTPSLGKIRPDGVEKHEEKSTHVTYASD